MSLSKKIAVPALLGLSALTTSFSTAALPAAQRVTLPERSLSFYNLHTEERLTVTYWRNGAYDAEGMRQAAYILRDHRRNEQTAPDPALLDTLHDIRARLKRLYPQNAMEFQVISGYRAAETTDELRRQGMAVARDKSQHQTGGAMDFRIEGVPLRVLRDTAWCMQRGGVGYYAETHNNFVHVDTGRVRFWPASTNRWACMRK